jgi:hypothetical protein
MMRYVDRRRAPQREGQRTTLRVPDDVMRVARDLAAELGSTPNDALVHLAQDGAQARERRLRAERLARQRREAVARGAADTSALPAPHDLRDAMLSGRRES